MRRGLPILAAAALPLLAACEGPQSVLDAQGPSAAQLKQLIILIVSVCSIVWALVMVVLIWALFRSRREPRPAHPSGERRLLRVVLASVAVTVIIISGLTVASFYATRAATLAGQPDLTIKVRGQQWWWELEYLDPDPSRSFKTANEIQIPVGRNVRLQLEAADVIHSFWVPHGGPRRRDRPGRRRRSWQPRPAKPARVNDVSLAAPALGPTNGHLRNIRTAARVPATGQVAANASSVQSAQLADDGCLGSSGPRAGLGAFARQNSPRV